MLGAKLINRSMKKKRKTWGIEKSMPLMEDREMMGGFGMGFMGIFWVVLLAVIAVLVWQYIKKEKDREGSKSSPLEIIRQRYARGEIEKEEYEEKKKDLIE